MSRTILSDHIAAVASCWADMAAQHGSTHVSASHITVSCLGGEAFREALADHGVILHVTDAVPGGCCRFAKVDEAPRPSLEVMMLRAHRTADSELASLVAYTQQTERRFYNALCRLSQLGDEDATEDARQMQAMIPDVDPCA